MSENRAHRDIVRPWKFCENKAVSLTYLSLGMEGRRIIGSQEPNIQIDQVSTKDLWESLDQVFTKQQNITFDRYTFLTRKQLKEEPVEKFWLSPGTVFDLRSRKSRRIHHSGCFPSEYARR